MLLVLMFFVNRPLPAWLMQDSPIPTPCVCVFFRWYSRWSDLYVSMCSSVSMLYVALFSVYVLVGLGSSASVALLVLHSWLFLFVYVSVCVRRWFLAVWMSCSVIMEGSLSMHCDVSIDPTQSCLLSS